MVVSSGGNILVFQWTIMNICEALKICGQIFVGAQHYNAYTYTSTQT